MTLDMKKIKERLLARKAELEQQAAGLDQAYPTPVDPVEANDPPTDFEENAVDVQEMQQEQSILVTDQSLLIEVIEALKRIDEGTYGKCVVCGKPIPEKRLEAIPWASRCVKDQEQLEQRNLRVEETYDADTI